MVTKICNFESFKEKITHGLGRSIGVRELFTAINDPKVIKSVVRQLEFISRKTEKYSCFNIDGWTVRLSLDGYYRMYKTISGKTESIYLGKDMSYGKARRKIAKKEKELNISL